MATRFGLLGAGRIGKVHARAIGSNPSAKLVAVADAFEKAIAFYTAKYPLGDVPRPPHWSGFRIVPQVIEFWHDRPFRLHDRIEFRRDAPGKPWVKTRLYP